MKKVLITLLLLAMTITLFGETSLSLDIRFFQTVYRGMDNEIYGQSNGTVGVNFRSTGNSDVKGELQLEYIPMNEFSGLGEMAVFMGAPFSLKKASIKVRFPGLRVTLGKTRVGWGEGSVFNSGDVLFGSLSPLVDLTQDEARTDTAWLTMVRWSPGGRTWVEAIYMPPSPQLLIDEATDSINYHVPDITHSSKGLRLVTEILDTTVEVGYLYKGETKVFGDVAGHRPYINLHGELYFDLYGSVSMAIPYEELDWENSRGTLNISAGMFRQFQLWYDGTLSTRLELIVFPYQKWEVPEGGLDLQSGTESYGLFLYPEFNLAIGRNWNIPLMAMISPIDQSAKVTTGFSWQVYQGLSFLGYGVFELGEEGDVFAWDRSGNPGPSDHDSSTNGWSAMLGMQYIF